MISYDTGTVFNAYILKYPAKADGWDIDEEFNAPEGETLREHSLSGKVV
ncbi:conserved protein of unknown function [Pseudodesulfovibrio profundus]|uniref:Uncharacterized protein n=1 Tax=Pseudodesulfovibrio profundus TaxID=57320 RepID=A0A2C8FA75_9BACT|nr:hypothetical protein [Pseudodesulfovibrio profundus]SOB59347.1 conserved protein of unknown function [Pseudodesulfovibrio profundus]